MNLQEEIQKLRESYNTLNAEVKTLRAENIFLKSEVQRLKDQLSKNSNNSSKPPSSDVFKKEPKPNPKSQRGKSTRKVGGQHGHKGHKLTKVDDPDLVVLHKLNVCSYCNKDLSKVTADVESRQEFDIPPLSIQVTEHRAEVKTCPCCGRISRAVFPDGLIQEAQYGPRIKAFLTYINQYHFIPYARSRDIIRDVFNHNISVGTINNILANCHELLDEAEAAIKEDLVSSLLLHGDETGMRVDGKLHWQHVISTETLTYYGINKKRGHAAIEETDILPNYAGTLVHDYFAPYLRYGNKHILCNAHHLRELTFIEEQYKQDWAKHMKSLLIAIKHQRDYLHSKGINEFPDYRIKAYKRCYDEIIMQGLWHKENIPKLKRSKKKGRQGPNKQSKGKNLLDRLRFHEEEVLAFMYDFAAPFDNNLAERDLRMSKVKQKVSGCFRSELGAKYFCRIRSYISTARKNGIQILDALEKAFLGAPFIPNLAEN